MACYNFDTHERKRRFTMPPQITCASALPAKTGKHGNHIFHTNAV